MLAQFCSAVIRWQDCVTDSVLSKSDVCVKPFRLLLLMLTPFDSILALIILTLPSGVVYAFGRLLFTLEFYIDYDKPGLVAKSIGRESFLHHSLKK